MTIRVLRISNTTDGKNEGGVKLEEETLVLTPEELDLFHHMAEVPENEAMVTETLTPEQRDKFNFLK